MDVYPKRYAFDTASAYMSLPVDLYFTLESTLCLVYNC